MFRAESWAEAFVKGAGGDGEAERALEYLRVFCRAAQTLPGELSGRNDGDRLGSAIKAALSHSERACGSTDPAAGHALRFVQLMLRRARFQRYRRIILAVETLLRERRGKALIIVETAVEPGGELLEAIRKRAPSLTGGREALLSVRIIPSLLGGLRLRWGSLLFDGSLKTKLQRMEADLGKH